MSKVTLAQVSMASGEISPLASARYDLERYANGLESCYNMIVHALGMAYRRPPTQYVNAASGDYANSHFIEFEFSTTQAYIIELGDQAARFYKDGGIIETTPGTAYEIVTPWAEADLPGLQWTQSADVLYVCHPDYPPQKISRSGHTSWTVTEFLPDDGPFGAENTDTAKKIKISAETGSGLTLTATGFTFDGSWIGEVVRLREEDKIYAPEWLPDDGLGAGVQYRYGDNVYSWSNSPWPGTNPPVHTEGTWEAGAAKARWLYRHSGHGYVRITAVAPGGATATCDVLGKPSIPASILAASSGTSYWSRQAWGETNGYPSVVAIHEQRLTFANTPAQPQTIWFSRSANYDSFEGGADADHAITYTLAGQQVTAIRWLTSGTVLTVGTSSQEFVVSAATSREAITPDNISIRPSTREGSADMRAAGVESSTFFVSRDRRRVHQHYYDFQIDGFRADDLTLLSEHLTEGKIHKIVWQRDPVRVLWVLMDTGRLVGLTFRREQSVVAWHPHQLGGEGTIVDDMAVIPASDESGDELWLAVKYKGNAAKRWIERIKVPPNVTGGTLGERVAYYDHQLVYEGAGVTTVSGLGHLEGEYADVMMDGTALSEPILVTGGEIELPRVAKRVIVGKGEPARIKPLRAVADFGGGATLGSTIKVKRTAIALRDSLGATVRHPKIAGTQIRVFKTRIDAMGSAPPLDSGIFPVTVPGAWDTDGQFILEQTTGYALNVLGIVSDIETGR